MYNSSTNPTLSNCIFNGNSAGDDGGGMYNKDSSNSKLTNCTFSGNKALGSSSYGGGICNKTYSSLTLTNCTFRDNLAGGGGGIYNGRETRLLLNNCTFSNNSAEDGGGIYNHLNDPTVTNCMFTGNTAEWGGGIYCWFESNVKLINCVFLANSAANGSALACDSYQQKYPSNFQITNCILWDGDGGILNNDTSTISIMYSDIQGGWPGEGNIGADPCFVDPGYWDADGVWIDGDYHLLPGSPCIDAGDPSYIAEPNATDLDGKPRVIDCRIDMGAYEYGQFVQFVPAEVRIIPRTINLASKGNWITCYIWLPEEYDVSDIDPNSILFECEIEVESLQVDEEEQIAVARFNRENVQTILNVGEQELTISVHLMDGTAFEGRDVIKVIDKDPGK
jgi:parallel beta-helix repeat protein